MRRNGIGELCELLRDNDELRGQRVSEVWLKAYLDAGEQTAVSRLSVFAGSFNAAGAAAVAYDAGATHAKADKVLLHIAHWHVAKYFFRQSACPRLQRQPRIGLHCERASPTWYIQHLSCACLECAAAWHKLLITGVDSTTILPRAVLTSPVGGWTGAHDLGDEQGSWQQLLDPAAVKLLARLRPMAIVREHAGDAEAGNALWAGPRYTTHPLIREVAAEMLTSRHPEERMQACRAFAQFLLSCGEEMRKVAGNGSEAHVIAQELLGMELVNFRELARLLAEPASKILSPLHPKPLVGLAAFLWELGHLVAAAELGRATLRALEHNNVDLSHARSCLAEMLTHEGALDQAEKLARKSLYGLTARLGQGHADAVSARENLALTLLQREQMKRSSEGGKAPEAKTEDLVFKQTSFGSAEHTVEGKYKPSGNKHEGKKFGFSCFACLRPKTTGTALIDSYGAEERPLSSRYSEYEDMACSPYDGCATGLHRFATGLHGFAKDDEVVDLQHVVLRGYEKGDEVVRLLWAVLEARETTQGSEHLDTIFARANLAATLRQRGQLYKAEELLRSVLASQVQVLGQEHPDTVWTRAELASLLESRNRILCSD